MALESDGLSGHARAGLFAGMGGALLATAGLLGVAAILERPSVPEILAECVATLVPLELIERVVQLLGSTAKHSLFTAVLAGHLAVGGCLGLYAARQRWRTGQIAIGVGGLAALTALVVALLGWTGLIETAARAGASTILTTLALATLLYLLGYTAVWRYLHPSGIFALEEAAGRRAFVTQALLLGGGLALGIVGFRWLAGRLEPPAVAPRASVEASRTTAAIAEAGSLEAALQAGVPGLSSEITPNDRFYVVSKNFFRDPEVDAGTWRLDIVGRVARPLTLTYADITALPSSTQFFTLQCISNEVGGELIGNAEWRGVPLADLLDRVGVLHDAVDVVFHAADGYTDSVPLVKALQPDTMVAFEMNGVVLPAAHGFPVRMLIPDIYGMKNVKWVTRIEVLAYDYKGYWMQRGWSDVATMHTTARIDVPKRASYLRPGTSYVGGIALAGQRGIHQVEVSTDGGQTWRAATVKPALGTNAWSLWLYAWEMPTAGTAETTIQVRATDGTGTLQSATIRPTLPDGATGYHTITVRREGS